MLKKRILASSLASVMALSSVSVVAFADETATADDFKAEVVDRATLKDLVKGFEGNFLEVDIFDFGTIQASRFQDAYDHAKNVAENSKATADDVTAAYQMLKVVYDGLVTKTADELKALIEECKPEYDNNNILNEEIGDYIYDEQAFFDFKGAYENAEAVVDSEDGRLITDAWFELTEKYEALADKKLDTVTKSQYRAVIKEFETMISQFNKYESWRRGTVSKKPTTGEAKDAGGSKLDLTKAAYVTWGELQEIVAGTSKSDPVKTIKTAGDADTTIGYASNTWISVSAGATKTVTALVYECSETFDLYKSTNITTSDTILAGYKAAKEALDVFNSWKADSYNNAVKGNVATTINKYRAQLAADFATDLTTDLISAMGTFDNTANGGTPSDNKLKLDGTKLVAQTKISLNIDKKTGLVCVTSAAATAYQASPADGTFSVINIAAGTDIMKYIPVKSANVSGTGKKAIVKNALAIVETYEAEEAKASKDRNWAAIFGDGSETTFATFNDVKDLDENGTVSTPGGSAREYTLINRFLNYALSDLYPVQAEACSHTKKDIKNIIAEAYDLIEKTGDSYVFAAENADLAEARKLAVEWVREADSCKTYKDNDAVNGVFAYGTEGNLTATAVYHKLSDNAAGAYDVLAAKWAKYPISYGEIAEKIADVAEAVEDGVYGEAVLAALKDVAFGLSTLQAANDDNAAFTSDRELNKFNRLFVDKDKSTASEKALKTALDNLDKAIEEDSKEPEVVLGDLTGDGFANADDAIMIVKAFVGEITLTDAQEAAADFNGDGVVNADDALAIVKASVGL